MKFICNMMGLMLLLALFNKTIAQPSDENKMVPFATGINNIVGITHAGDSRLFVTDQSGIIRIVNADGSLQEMPFLDISDKVTFGGERGLLGLAFHPSYATNGYFYVNYVGKANRTIIARYKVMADNPQLADPSSEVILMTILQPFMNHNGGHISFGPDSMLYIGLGDGGSAGDPQNNANDPLELLGKMLRIDVNHGDPYAIPASNPFFNTDNARGEIWALGLRNPWRFSFDRFTGDLWIADVGQDKYEEINFQPASSKGGENYGWRCYEGNEAFNRAGCESNAKYTFPIYTYNHDEGCSITGGYVYRANPSSPYYGQYFFTDYCTSIIWTLHKAGDSWVRADFGSYPGSNFTTFGEDVNGELYLASAKTGTIFKVISSTTGVQDNPLSKEVKVIQLPGSSKIRIETSQNAGEEMKIIMADMKGTVIFTANTRDKSYEFDPGDLPAGTYVVNVGANGKKFTQKLIVTKP